MVASFLAPFSSSSFSFFAIHPRRLAFPIPPPTFSPVPWLLAVGFGDVDASQMTSPISSTTKHVDGSEFGFCRLPFNAIDPRRVFPFVGGHGLDSQSFG